MIEFTFSKFATKDLEFFNIFRMLKVVVRKCSVKKDVLRNFAKLTVKPLCQSLFS